MSRKSLNDLRGTVAELPVTEQKLALGGVFRNRSSSDRADAAAVARSEKRQRGAFIDNILNGMGRNSMNRR